MKIKALLTLIVAGLAFSACSDDDENKLAVLSVNPASGNSGQEVTITGENFGTVATDVTVRFGPSSATITSITDVQIVTSVPSNAPIGATTIQVVKGDETDNIDFTVEDPLVGNWISEGTNLAPLLAGAPFNTVRITADFRANGTYTVVTTDNNNSQVTLEGTWSTSEGAGVIRNIVVTQSSPTSLTSEGIYSNVDGLLTYEVAQTNPPLTGVTAPTAAAGFGSTSGGAFGALNIQKYVRAN